MSYSIVFNDKGPNMDVALVANGGPFALQVDDEVVLRYIDPAGLTHEVALTVDNFAGGLTHRKWADGDLPETGGYKGQVEIRRLADDSFPRTLPNNGTYVHWPVHPKI